MLALIAAAAFAWAPPGEAPLPPTGESVLYEPPVPDDAFAPVEITPPEPPPRPSPDPPPVIEQHPPPLAPPALPPPPPPPTGAGRLVGGSFALGLGFAATAAVVVEVTRTRENPSFIASTFVPLGLASFGVGTYLLVRGAKARANFNDWRSYTGHEARPTGEGLIVAGTMSLVIGGVTLVAASARASDPETTDALAVPLSLALGGAFVATGVGTLTWGLLRRSRYRIWRQSTFLGALPLVVPMRGGASVGVVGRF